ncbi:MAG: chemotaxis response regulator protein-glutamate methylesterase [Gammaproteobacteria bacterium]|nr:chemotaxis response regulator protein-glutamate methylesterase [Gammaproteobacteria bacterium]
MSDINKKIKVLIVDDSAVIRQVMADIMANDKDIEMDAAADPIFAMRHMEKQWPDVIVLDVEMPRMDGITFLRKIMSERPTPVVMCSTLTASGTKTTLEALSAGAIDIITKPKAGAKAALIEENKLILDTIKSAAKARNLKKTPVVMKDRAPQSSNTKLTADAIISKGSRPVSQLTDKIIAIGTSTGGTQALEIVLTELPANCPGIVVVQHMPEKFTKAFAERLNSVCSVSVCEAENGQRIMRGQVIIAPGGKHMTIVRHGAQYSVEVVDGPLVNRHRPSVDVLFRSVAKFAGKNALGIIMTGMGDDGARGLKEIRESGAHTLGQDEATCIVYGMPNEAFKLGAVERQVPLEKIASEISKF